MHVHRKHNLLALGDEETIFFIYSLTNYPELLFLLSDV